MGSTARSVAGDTTVPDVSRQSKPELGDVGIDDESTLMRALDRASSERQWAIVAQLAKELEARRLARAGNVVRLTVKQHEG